MAGDQVRHNEAACRYELGGGSDPAIAAYRREGETIVFTHTEVPGALGGRGVGSRLVQGALDDVRRQGRKVLPLCPFVAGFIERHPETQDLLVDD